MFTGIVEELGQVVAVQTLPDGRKVVTFITWADQ